MPIKELIYCIHCFDYFIFDIAGFIFHWAARKIGTQYSHPTPLPNKITLSSCFTIQAHRPCLLGNLDQACLGYGTTSPSRMKYKYKLKLNSLQTESMSPNSEQKLKKTLPPPFQGKLARLYKLLSE